MAIKKEQLPAKVWEGIDNLTTLLEIGTGSDTQDEFIREGLDSIVWMMDECKSPFVRDTANVYKCQNNECHQRINTLCTSTHRECTKAIDPSFIVD